MSLKETLSIIKRGTDEILVEAELIEKLKEKDPQIVDNINKLKNQILYNTTENEI